MNWSVPYDVSRALTLQIGDGGALLARSSLSRAPQALADDGLPVLLAFAGGRTAAEALRRLRDEWEIDDDGFAAVVDALVAQNLLTPAGGDDAALATGGFASLADHFSMLADAVRVSAYRQAIFRHCRDRSVVEIGCGSGILSIFAAQAGARRVIAIEESRIADVAAAMFEANGVADRIELRRANSRDVSIDERAEVIIHEVLGVDPFGENILPFIEDARDRFLAPGGRLIPSALEVFCAGFEVPDRPYLDREQACAELTDLGASYGVDFRAFQRFLRAAPRDPFGHPLGEIGRNEFTPRILTAATAMVRIDFAPGSPMTVEPRGDLRLRAEHSGLLGGVVVYFRAQLDEETFLSTAPDAPRTSWGWNARPLARRIAVQPGDEIPLVASLGSSAGAQRLEVDLP